MNAPISNTATRTAEVVTTYGLPAIILTMPLEFTARFMHQQLSRFVMVVVLIALAYLVIRGRRNIVVPLSASMLVLLLLVGASVVSWLFSRAPGSTNSLLDIVLYPLFALLVVNLAVTEADHRRAWIALIVSGLLVALTGVVLYVTHSQIWAPNPLVAHRVNITFADPNITARFLTLCACASVLLFAARKAPLWMTMGAAVACAAVLPLTFSRSGLALFILMVLLMIPLAFDRKRAAAIGAVALVVFVLSTGLNPDTRQRAIGAEQTLAGAIVGVSSHSAGSARSSGGVALDDNRVFLVAAGVKMFTDHPLAGVGFGGYQHALLTTYRRFLPESFTDSVSHTAVVTVMAEQGVIGALLLAAFLLLLAREAWLARRRRDGWAVWATIAAALVVPIFMYSQFEARFLQEPYLWLSLAMFYAAEKRALRAPSVELETQPRRAWRRIEVA